MSIQGAINQMRAWNLLYRQVLGEWNNALGGVLRPDPSVAGYGDCTSTIQHAFLKNGLPNPGYFTGDMRTRGKQIASSKQKNFGAIRAGDVLLMQWPSGVWHAELAVNNTTCIGHGGPGRGPYQKNIRSYLGQMAYWEARRHAAPAPAPKPQANNSSSTSNSQSTNQDIEEEEETMRGLFYDVNPKTRKYMLFNENSGFYSEFSAGTNRGNMSGSYVNSLAKNWDTSSWPQVTPGHATALKKDLDRVRRRA